MNQLKIHRKSSSEKVCAVYSRQSATTKTNYNIKNASSLIQKELLCNHAKGEGYNKIKCYEEVVPARDIRKQKQLNLLLQENDNIPVFTTTVARFSRNKVQGLEMIQKLKDKNMPVHFISDSLTTGKNDVEIKKKLAYAEYESKEISKRMKRSKNYKRKRGEFLGGAPKYGLKCFNSNKLRKLQPNLFEKAVIKFILEMKIGKLTCDYANYLMKCICNPKFLENYEPIYFYDEDGNVISKFTKKNVLTFQEIADLLNEYQVKNRKNKKWTRNYVNHIFNNN